MKNKWLGSIFSEKGLGSILNVSHNCAVANTPPESHKSGKYRNIDCKTHGKILFPPVIDQASAGALWLVLDIIL